jgi:hypothetical protein
VLLDAGQRVGWRFHAAASPWDQDGGWAEKVKGEVDEGLEMSPSTARAGPISYLGTYGLNRLRKKS